MRINVIIIIATFLICFAWLPKFLSYCDYLLQYKCGTIGNERKKQNITKIIINIIVFIIAIITVPKSLWVHEIDQYYKDDVITYSVPKGKTRNEIHGNGFGMLTFYSINIDTEDHFEFYYKIEDGSYKHMSIEMDNNFYIKEIEEDTCYITKTERTNYTVYKSQWLGEIIEEDKGFKETDSDNTFLINEVRYILYVPVGTLTNGEIILD